MVANLQENGYYIELSPEKRPFPQGYPQLRPNHAGETPHFIGVLQLPMGKYTG